MLCDLVPLLPMYILYWDVCHNVCGITSLVPINIMKIHENQLAWHFIIVAFSIKINSITNIQC